MMLYCRLTAVLLLGIVLLSLTSCSDPASVGTGIGPDSLAGGDPQVKELVPSTFDTTTSAPQTGYAVPATVSDQQRRPWRFLTGIVEDPIAGTMVAAGYVDFLGTRNRPDGLSDASVDSLNAELRLNTSFRHGDTTSTLDVQLYDLRQSVEMHRAPADTSFEAEAQPIASYSLSPADSQVVLPLPESWIREHQTAIQDSTSFDNTTLHGFKLATTNESAVLGFEHASATLRVTTSADTVNFQTQQSFTHIERDGSAPPLPDNLLRLQDGIGTAVSMSWTDDSRLDSLADARVLLNRAVLTVPIDTTFLQPPAGSDFVRPLPSGYRILAPRAEGAPECGQLGLFSLTEADETCILPTSPDWVPYAARAVPQATFAIFERWFFETAPITSFRVEIANRNVSNPTNRETARRGLPSTLPAVVPVSDLDADRLPRATLTVTPL